MGYSSLKVSLTYLRGLEEAELEDAKWFKIDDLPNVPPKLSISGQLISSYLEDRSKL